MREAKDWITTTKDETTEVEETPKSMNTLGTEEARKPTAATRKEINNPMETKPGTAGKTGGPRIRKPRTMGKPQRP